MVEYLPEVPNPSTKEQNGREAQAFDDDASLFLLRIAALNQARLAVVFGGEHDYPSDDCSSTGPYGEKV